MPPKNRFGAGYTLSMARTSSDCNPHTVEAAIRSVVPSAALTSSVAGEMVFSLPLIAVGSFAKLFSMLQVRAICVICDLYL